MSAGKLVTALAINSTILAGLVIAYGANSDFIFIIPGILILVGAIDLFIIPKNRFRLIERLEPRLGSKIIGIVLVILLLIASLILLFYGIIGI
jgi:hypothetical protein